MAAPDRGLPEQTDEGQAPHSAQARKSRWPGWIWGVPVAALLIVGWLAFKQIAASGPTVTVVFDRISGIQPGNTQVNYDGLKVGEVDGARLQKDMHHLDVTITMDREMAGQLGKGTQFWLAGTKATLGDLSSLKSIISGPTIGMMPSPGPKQARYQGLSEPPVVPETVPGRHFVLHAAKLGSLSRGSPVYFADLKVGSVEQTAFQADHGFAVTVFVRSPFNPLVRTGTRFWKAGPVQLAMLPSGPELRMQSLSALVEGAVDFVTPADAREGPPASEGASFPLYDSQDTAEYAPGPRAVTYRVAFPHSAGGLAGGAGVELAGKRVGTVVSSSLAFDQRTGQLLEQSTIALEPANIALTGGEGWSEHPRGQMDAMLSRLIGEGLRAQLGSQVPVMGAKGVQLVFTASEGKSGLLPGDPPGIPAVGGGSGIAGITMALNRITHKLDALPLDQIGQNVQVVSERLARLSNSPALTDTLRRLDQSVQHVEHLTATANTNVPQLVAELRRVAGNLNATVIEARTVLNNRSGVTATGTETAGLSQTLYELSQAARAVRQLSDLLERQPTALIRGKS